MKKKRILKYDTGGSIDEYLNIKRRRIGELPNSIETPDEAIAQNELNLSKALVKSENGLTNTLDFLGAAGLQIGTSMMSKGSLGENPSGLEKALFNNKDSIIGALNLLGGSSQFAKGGTVNNPKVEVEGQEVAELPNGQVGEFQGPSHEDGGIKMNLPEGTDIYSKRIKVEGKTMAERKLARERKIESLMKLIEKNPLDKTLKQTLKKVQENNDFLDEKDMLIQNTLHSYNQGIKRAYGGTLEDEEDDEELNDDFSYADYIDDEEEEDDFYYDDEEDSEDDYYTDDEDSEDYEDDEEEEYKMGGTVKKFLTGGTNDPNDPRYYPNNTSNYVDLNEILDPLTLNILKNKNINDVNNVTKQVTLTDSGVEKPSIISNDKNFDLNNLFGNISLGDALGMAGSLKGAYTGKKNTLANALAK